MNIGFVSTWFERGGAYVTKAYLNALKDDHQIFVYARGGENFAKEDPNWNLTYVTWGLNLLGTNINLRHFKKWITKNKIDVLLFNEQHESEILYRLKHHLPNIKIGAYIDYYKENTVEEFKLYDFLICNTKRHYSVFKDHPQCYYLPWGTDTNLFKPQNVDKEKLTFFHSAGMSKRKGTKMLIDAFIDGDLYKNSKLIIHSQFDVEKGLDVNIDKLKRYNINIIQKTVTAPGLYHLGDIYVYPTTLDGLGLTLYEALACGLPVITTNNAPMNEVINDNVGYLVDVDYYRSRSDAYYWPLSIIKKESLIEGMKFFVNNKEKISSYQISAREEALNRWSWEDRVDEIKDIFTSSKIIVQNPSYDQIAKNIPQLDKLKRKIGSSYLFHIIKQLLYKKK